jgi:hypothetical protein
MEAPKNRLETTRRNLPPEASPRKVGEHHLSSRFVAAPQAAKRLPKAAKSL